MRKIKKYAFTTPKCYNCNNSAYKHNQYKLPCCKQCYDKNVPVKCILCNEDMEVKSGKYGTYFHCTFCKVNLSVNRVKNINKFK